MLSLEPNKVYTLQITFPDSAGTLTEIAMGSKVRTAIEDAKNRYPSFRRIIVYDTDTGDVVSWVKS